VSNADGGRSLKKSVLIGLILGGIFLVSVLIVKEGFILLAMAGIAGGSWELASALRQSGWYVPRVPVVVGSAVIMPATYYFGTIGQWTTSLVIIAALTLWRLVHLIFERREAPIQAFGKTIRDFSAAAFVVIYLPLTFSFAILLLQREKDGAAWVCAAIVTAAFSDTAGYLIGRKFGKHKLAPGVSPKKTWEGLLGSIIFGASSAIFIVTVFVGAPWWIGLIVAASVLLAAIFGDLSESLIKRDLGIKDMSSWLPGHGGLMDRLDSILPSVLVTYLIATLLVPQAL
jgi:phosphatidate cytidylyltransferase